LKETFGERVLRLRRRQHMSQSDLARVLDVERGSIMAWERDRHAPTKRHRARLARALGSTVQYLADGDTGKALRLQDAALEALKRLTESG
jgi:transcriptional regulator with XRE-family HTH domain